MGKSICETTESLLASVQEEIDDPDLSYKLRTARQLALACKHHHEMFEQTLEQAELDSETVENLRELGYLE